MPNNAGAGARNAGESESEPGNEPENDPAGDPENRLGKYGAEERT